jgi:predicted lipoprotein with Yx(FWY)xxD motif
MAGCSSTSTPSNSAAGATTPAASTGAPSSAASGAVTISAKTGPDGTYLTDGAGRTLYLFEADKGSTSACSGQCATAWPPLTTTGTPAAGSGVTASQLATAARSDGTMQVTYNGHPLYYFVQDKSPGQTTGQATNFFGAAWYIVSPTGTAITLPASGSSSGSSPSPSSTGAGGAAWS